MGAAGELAEALGSDDASVAAMRQAGEASLGSLSPEELSKVQGGAQLRQEATGEGRERTLGLRGLASP